MQKIKNVTQTVPYYLMPQNRVSFCDAITLRKGFLYLFGYNFVIIT